MPLCRNAKSPPSPDAQLLVYLIFNRGFVGVYSHASAVWLRPKFTTTRECGPVSRSWRTSSGIAASGHRAEAETALKKGGEETEKKQGAGRRDTLTARRCLCQPDHGGPDGSGSTVVAPGSNRVEWTVGSTIRCCRACAGGCGRGAAVLVSGLGPSRLCSGGLAHCGCRGTFPSSLKSGLNTRAYQWLDIFCRHHGLFGTW